MNLQRLTKSFKFAFNGVKLVFREEQNFRIELYLGLLTLVLALLLQVSRLELIVIILMVFVVLSLELINSVFELFVDMLKPKVHAYAKAIKDIMSGIVLIACFGSIIIGLLIFVPEILEKF